MSVTECITVISQLKYIRTDIGDDPIGIFAAAVINQSREIMAVDLPEIFLDHDLSKKGVGTEPGSVLARGFFIINLGYHQGSSRHFWHGPGHR